MFAVVEIAGRQYKVAENDNIEVEKLDTEAGGSITFNRVLLLSDETGSEAKIGKPYLTGASVVAKVVEQFKGDKIVVHKFRAKKRYAKTQGHRQNYTRLEITSIKG